MRGDQVIEIPSVYLSYYYDLSDEIFAIGCMYHFLLLNLLLVVIIMTRVIRINSNSH